MKQFLCYEKTGNRFLKKLGISILFLFFTLGLKAQCPPGNVILTSQTEVDAFATNYPNCTEISGYMIISGSTITDLSPLSNLTSVGGFLDIYNNLSLTNLDGLSNLTSVGGYLRIDSNSNSNLTNLDGLSNLTSVGGFLLIGSNSNLTNLDGLSNLTSVGADLVIRSNSSLTDISGLENINPSTFNYLEIKDNPNLSVCNLENFCTYLAGSGPRTISGNAGYCISEAAVTTACISACDAPTNLTATNITSVSATLGWTSDGNNFDIEWGTQGFTQGSGTLVTDIATNSYNLTNLDYNTQYQFYIRQDCTVKESDWAGPFSFTTLPQCPAGDVILNSQTEIDDFATNHPNCTEISGGLYISGNDITDLSPLSNLTSVGGYLDIYNNSNLTNLDGLSNLTSVGGFLYIGSNSNLTNLDGLSNLTQIGGSLSIQTNAILENLDGLSNLTSVGGGLDISYNSSLTNLDGLSNLTSVGGYLDISYNLSLTNLDGLSNLTSVGADLVIYFNYSLTDISGLENINPSTFNYLKIKDNPNLSVCNLENFCTYLAGSGPRTISGNAGDCISEAAVTTACIPCDAPTNLTATNITSVSATLGWTSDGNNFDIEWGTQGFTQGSGTTVTGITANSYNLTNLDYNTQYQFYIRQDCTVNESDWAGPFSFTTLPQCPTGYLSFNSQAQIDDFATNHPNCTEISGDLYISGSTIADLSPFSNLTSIGGYLFIGTNSNLTNLNGLSNLTSVGGFLRIDSNSNLTNLDGLSNLTSVGGFLSIYNNSSLTNLDGLSNLTSVGGNLGISSNSSLTDLDGLSNLTSVGGNLFIESNSNLTNLDGLSNLTSVGGYLRISSNSSLTDLDGLSNLTSVGADLVILSNSSLTDISGLQNIDPASILSTNGLGLYIMNNSSLSVCNLENFCTYLAGSGPRTISGNAGDCISEAAVTTACIPACDAPTNLTATNITSVSATLGWTSDGNNFDIEWGTQGFTQGSGTLVTDIATNSYNLTNLDYNTQYQFYIRQDCTVNESDWAGPFSFTTLTQCPAGGVSFTTQEQIDAFATNYPNCTEISGGLYISGNDITDLSPLSNLTSIGGSLDINNSNLTDLDGLSNLTSVGGFLFIYSNSNLTNLDGLSNLTSVGGNLYIYNNLSLTNLDGLSNLTSVGGYLFIDSNSNLTNLDGLNNLTSVGGYLSINSNLSLTNLDGLSNLTSVGADLLIQSNPSLTDISGLQNIDPATILSTYGYGLYIQNNPLLSVCNLDNFCTYLAGSGPRTISGNAGDCVSVSAIQNACDLSGNCDSYTIWNGTDWSNGIPNQDKRAIIEGDLTLTEDLTACELLLNSGILTVNSGVTLTVKGVIENTQSATNFIVENGANLIQTDDVDNIGAITVYKNSSDIKHLDYTIWSSPVEGQGLKAFSPQTLWYRIYTYTPAADPANDQWSQVFDTSSDPDQNFEQGIGYMFRAPNDFVTTPYTYNGEFTGVPNNGEVTVNFTTTGKYQSLGNPYPSSISTTDLQTETDLGTLYFWTNTNPWDDNQGNYTANNWATYNGVGGVAAANDTKEPNAFIPTGQGFVADTEIAPNTYLSEITFTNAMRTSNEGVFFKVMEEEKHRLWLNLSDEQQMLNQTLIGYVQGATQELDYGIDAQMFGYSGSALYSLIENTENNFVIQGRALPFDDNDVVQLGFRAGQAGSFTISLSDFDGIFAEGQDIYLKDSFTQTEHNLKEGSYEFISEEGVFHTRFEITYKPSGDLNADIPNLNNHWVVYKKDNVFHIHSRGFEMKEVVVYDVLGRVVYSNLSEGNIHILPYLGANQVLIVKITTTDNTVLSKKVQN